MAKTGPKPIPEIERFWKYVQKTDTCWRWIGARLPNGYGVFLYDNRTGPAYRFAYKYFVGPIADGLEIDHVKDRGCQYRDCVNPAHLEAVTRAENMRRPFPVRTHCKLGHEMTEENFLYRSDRNRYKCKTCTNATTRARYLVKHGPLQRTPRKGN